MTDQAKRPGLLGGPIVIEGVTVDVPPAGYVWSPATWTDFDPETGVNTWKPFSRAEAEEILTDLDHNRYPVAQALSRLLRGFGQLAHEA